MEQEENEFRRHRVHVVYGAVFCALTSLVLRLSYLQIAHGAEFRDKANTTMLAKLPVLPSRGWVYDANGKLLAYDRPSFSVVLTKLRSKVQNLHAMSRLLGPVFGVSPTNLYAQMTDIALDGETQVRILKNATESQISFVAEHASKLPGVHVVEESQRVYTYGELASHVLGYVHSQPADKARYYANKGYLPDQWVGIDGVEYQYEPLLQGKVGYRSVEVNSLGVPMRDFGLSPAPVRGDKLQLTLDGHLQAVAQQIVVDELNQVRRKYGYHPKDAEAVLLDAKTGGLLALVSYPFYNPNWFVTSRDYSLHANYLWGSMTPTVNHVLQSPRAPGSTVKPVNILAGLQTGAIGRWTTIVDRGSMDVGTYHAKDWNPSGHGVVGPVKAIQESCDIYMYNVGMWMAKWHGGLPAGKTLTEWNETDRIRGLNALYQWEWMFGLGQKTGIDLPNENAGKFYTDERRDGKTYVVRYDLQKSLNSVRRTGHYPNSGLLYDNAFAAIGQMQQFTPIELAQSLMTIANGGRKLQPHVLKCAYGPDGRLMKNVGQIVQTQLPVSAEYMNVIKQGMEAVVNEPGGTAYQVFRGSPYRAAGKTGTAQQGQGLQDISLFVGYAPVNHPEVCVAIMVPGGGESGETAVPIGRKLFDAYFQEHHEFFPKQAWTDNTISPHTGM